MPDNDEFFKLMSKQEDLHPDLTFYLRTTNIGEVLQHPLVFSVPHHSMQNAMVNAQYKYKLEAVQEAREKKQWNKYIALHERPYRLQAFIKIRPQLHGDAYWETVSFIWIDSENIWQNRKAWRQIWSSKEPNREKVMDSEERDFLAQLSDSFVIYRGVKHKTAMRSLSWTLDQDKAKWFAKRLRFAKQKPILLTAEIQKSQAMAYMSGRSESEIIVSPKALSQLAITQEELA